MTVHFQSESVFIFTRNLHLHLVKDGYITHAGAWLLAKGITRHTLRAGVTCTLFRGVTDTYVIDRKDFTGDLYSIFESCIACFQTDLNTALAPHARGRDERLELPEDALREALVNTIAHRDYRSTARVQVHIFLDRIEIVTPGGLPAGTRQEHLGTRSAPRNTLLFGTFYRMWLVEQVGSGICRIRELCRDCGVAEPGIQISEHWVTATFSRQVEPGTDQGSRRKRRKSGPSWDQVGTKSHSFVSARQRMR